MSVKTALSDIYRVEEIQRVAGLIARYSREYGADEILMLNIAWAESNFNPRAQNPNSSARGIFQVIKGTWAHFRCTGERDIAEDNIRCAMKIATTSGLHHWSTSALLNGKGWLYLPYHRLYTNHYNLEET